jgi:hypothetical protein
VKAARLRLVRTRTREREQRRRLGWVFAGGGARGAYEIGVYRRRDGQPGYTLLWDFFGFEGQKMAKAVGGNDGRKLIAAYSEAVVRKTGVLASMSASMTTTLADGSRAFVLRTL